MTRTMAQIVATVAALGLLAPASPAFADSDSILTVGVGAGAGFRHLGGGLAPSETAFVNHGSVRVKVLWLLGADLSVDLTKDPKLTNPSTDAMVYASKIRTTALFYAIPASAFSLYLGGGIGTPKFSDLLDPASAKNSYHVGGGLEVHLTDHFSFDLSYYMIVPSVGGVAGHVERLAMQVAEDYQQETGGGGAGSSLPDSLDDLPLPDTTVGDFINPHNYELMLRIFLFL